MVSKALSKGTFVPLIILSLIILTLGNARQLRAQNYPPGRSSSVQEAKPLLEHSIMIYTSENNNLESSSFVDFAKLTKRKIDKSIAVHQLMDTKHQGSYKIHIYEDPYLAMKMARIHTPDMSNIQVLERFITQSMAESPAKKYSLIFQGHGWSFLLKTEENSDMAVSEIRKLLERLGVKFYLISLDMCLMSTIETIYELRNVTEYIAANEDYCPWNGIVSEKMLRDFEDEKNDLNLVRSIAQASADQNRDEKDPADLTVVKTDYVEELGQLVKSFQLKPEDFKDDYAIDPNEKDYEYDLYQVVMNHPTLSDEKKVQFHELFTNTVVFYSRNLSKINTGRPTYGISIMKGKLYPAMTDQQKLIYDELQFNQFHFLPMTLIRDYMSPSSKKKMKHF